MLRSSQSAALYSRSKGNYTEFGAVALVMGILFVADGVIMDRYFGLHDKKKGLKHNPFVTGFSIVLVRALE